MKQLFVVLLTYFLLSIDSVQERTFGFSAFATAQESGAVLVGSVRSVDSASVYHDIINSLNKQKEIR